MRRLSETLAWVHLCDVRGSREIGGADVGLLWRDELDAQAIVVDIPAGTTWRPPARRRRAFALVVGGAVDDGRRTYPAGTFIHCPSFHDGSFHSVDGARLFVLVLGIGPVKAQDGHPYQYEEPGGLHR